MYFRFDYMDKKQIRHTLKNKTNFLDILQENVNNYSGKYHEILIYAPNIYSLLCELLNSKKITGEQRNLICAAIAYFVLPKDIFPEKIFGVKGYIDDIYLCLYVLNQIKDKHGIEELIEYWDMDINILEKLLVEDYNKLNKEFNYILKDILQYIGIH